MSTIETIELDNGAFTGAAWRIMENGDDGAMNGALREDDASLLSPRQAAVLGYLEIASTRGAVSEFPVEIDDAGLHGKLAHAWDCGAMAWSGACPTEMCWPEAPADADEWIAMVLDQCPAFQAALDSLDGTRKSAAGAITAAKGTATIECPAC